MTSYKVKYLLAIGLLLFTFTCCGNNYKISRELSKIEKSIEAYHKNYGFYPASLDKLGIEIPPDPYGQGPYKYINWENEIVCLYSVGEDRQDDLSYYDLGLEICGSDQAWDIYQIEKTKDDANNGMAPLTSTLRTFSETEDQEINNQLDSIIRDGWISEDKTPEAASYIEQHQELLSLLRTHAKGPEVIPAMHGLLTGGPQPDIGRAIALTKLLIADGKKMEADGDASTAGENYFAVFMLVRACKDNVLWGKWAEMLCMEKAYNALHQNRAIDQQFLIERVMNFESELQPLTEVYRSELKGRIIQISRCICIADIEILNMFILTNRASIGTILTEIFEENIRRMKLPYRQFEQFRYNYANEESFMDNAINKVDRYNPHEYLLKDLLKQTQANGLLILAALRIYREQHKAYPDSLYELAPDILPEVPMDPFTNEPFIYKKTYFYSVGPDDRDNFGKISFNIDDGIKGSGDIIFGK